MKVAIIHDDLLRKGGAEKVTLDFHEAFPDADIYTLAYNKDTTYSEYKKANVITSWFQKISTNETVMKWLFFPLGIIAMRNLKIKGYDIILMSTTYCAKYVKTEKQAKTVCYCHQPFRIAWYPESYSLYLHSNILLRALLDIVLSLLRKIDLHYAKKINFFIANTSITKQKISQCYKLQPESIKVLKPSVNCSKFYISDQKDKKEYFLVVSRLEYYKKVDLVISAFNQLGLPLIVVGSGTKKNDLKKLAKGNITFMENINSATLSQLYAECEALIFPQFEDYGITALEANASGRPVIGYGFGGILDTTIPYKGNSEFFTSILFSNQTEEDLIDAIRRYQSLSSEIIPEKLREHTMKFDKSKFIQEIKKYVQDVYSTIKK